MITSVDLSSVVSSGGAARTSVLENEVHGLSSTLFIVKKDSPLTLDALDKGNSRILIIVSGVGELKDESGWSTSLSALKTIALEPGDHASCTLTVSSSGDSIEDNSLHLLELIVTGAQDDAVAAADAAARKVLPFALEYKDASTYSESFKSAKTISRTLIPKGIIPRFAAGSVQVIGPDAVGEHSHPMLEQYFLGLPGCNATVKADGETAKLGAWTLLHIPLGSTHGVSVDEGNELHYVWIDLFRDLAGEAWLDGHIEKK
jgi:quercetin dioxygenase-like cupin family protein